MKIMTPEEIDEAIEIEEDLYNLYRGQKLTPAQVDMAMEKESHLFYLYHYQNLTPSQIDRAMEIGKELSVLYRCQKFTPAQINRIIDIEIDENLDFFYYYQKLTPAQIDRAMDRGVYLDSLYEPQTLTPAQIDRAIEIGEDLFFLYQFQNLTPAQIDRVIDGRESSGVLYQYQKLSPLQIYRAMEVGEELNILFSHQNVTSKQIQRAIDNSIALGFLYTSPVTSEEQKKAIFKKLAISAPEGLLESEVWKSILPTDIFEAVRILNESIANKIDTEPVNDLIGVYSAINPFSLIKLKFADKGYYMKEGDFDYGYYISKDGREKKIKIGRILKENPKLLVDYREVKPTLKSVYEKTKSLTPLSENLEIVISNNPIDVAGKSTGKVWTSCETISSSSPYGWPPKCGWCDDVKANNLIAYIRRVGENQWIGRNIIRWCIRIDDKRPDVFIEQYYGGADDPNRPLYRWIMNYNLRKIVRHRGYSGHSGDTLCKTPYIFTGCLDSADSAEYENSHINYHLGERGGGIEEEKETKEKIVYYPKLVER